MLKLAYYNYYFSTKERICNVNICNLNVIEDEFHLLFTFPTYACVITKFYTRFTFVRPISGNIACITEFLIFIAHDIIVSFIVAINKLRLSNNLPAVIWLYILILFSL